MDFKRELYMKLSSLRFRPLKGAELRLPDRLVKDIARPSTKKDEAHFDPQYWLLCHSDFYLPEFESNQGVRDAAAAMT